LDLTQSDLYDTIAASYGQATIDMPADYSLVDAAQDAQEDDLLEDVQGLSDKGRQILENSRELIDAGLALFDAFQPQFPEIAVDNTEQISLPVLGSFTVNSQSLPGVSFLRAIFSLLIWLTALVMAIKIVRSAIA
jgi:hypothetical protein